MFFILETTSLTSATLRVRSGQVSLEHKKKYLDIPSVFFLWKKKLNYVGVNPVDFASSKAT